MLGIVLQLCDKDDFNEVLRLVFGIWPVLGIGLCSVMGRFGGSDGSGLVLHT